MFDRQFIEHVFEVNESVFNAAVIREMLCVKMNSTGVVVKIGDPVGRIQRCGDCLELQTKSGAIHYADKVVIAAYSGINEILIASGLPILPMKHEIAEIAIVQHPGPLSKIGVTVMDGPFFSTIPFPALHAHSLTHVRYTPHASWRDQEEFRSPYSYLASRDWRSNVSLMVNDARRYMPAIASARYVKSLFEIKTVLLANEQNDGRPILLRNDYCGIPGLTVVMGGKVDNVYDVLDAMGDSDDALGDLLRA